MTDIVDHLADLMASTLAGWIIKKGLLRDFLLYLDAHPEHTTFPCPEHGPHSIFTRPLTEDDLHTLFRLFIANCAERYDPDFFSNDDITPADVFKAM